MDGLRCHGQDIWIRGCGSWRQPHHKTPVWEGLTYWFETSTTKTSGERNDHPRVLREVYEAACLQWMGGLLQFDSLCPIEWDFSGTSDSRCSCTPLEDGWLWFLYLLEGRRVFARVAFEMQPFVREGVWSSLLVWPMQPTHIPGVLLVFPFQTCAWQGVYENICAVLGPKPLFWFLPCTLTWFILRHLWIKSGPCIDNHSWPRSLMLCLLCGGHWEIK